MSTAAWFDADLLVIAGEVDSVGTLNIGDGGAPGMVDVMNIYGGDGEATVNFNHTDEDYHFTYTGTDQGQVIHLREGLSVNHTGSGMTTLWGAHNYTGDTNVMDGTLILMGSAQNSAFTVHDGATLGGDGQIESLSVSNGGVFSPGAPNATGTFQISNDYTHSAGATLVVDITDQLILNGAGHDIVIVGGVVTIQGGEVQVRAADGDYSDGMTYEFLTGDALTGTFDSVTDNLAFLTATLAYDTSSAYIVLVDPNASFELPARTGNQRELGRYFDRITGNVGSGVQDVLDEVRNMSTKQVLSAYDQMAGQTQATGQAMSVMSATAANQTLSTQLRPSSGGSGTPVSVTAGMNASFEEGAAAPANRWGGWVRGTGVSGDVDTHNGINGFDYWSAGVLAGLDYQCNDNLLAGAYVGYQYGRSDSHNVQQRVESNQILAGLYARHTFDNHHTIVSAGGGYTFYDSERRMAFGGINSQADGDFDGHHFAIYGEHGLRFDVGDWELEPFAGLQYLHIYTEGYTETGAGPLNLQVERQRRDSLRSLLGARLRIPVLDDANGRAEVELRGMWMHEFLDEGGVAVQRLAAAGGPTFEAQTVELGRDWAVLGAGLNLWCKNNMSLHLDYDASVNSRSLEHVASATLRFTW